MKFRTIQWILISQLLMSSNLQAQNAASAGSAPAMSPTSVRDLQIAEAQETNAQLTLRQFDARGREIKTTSPVDMYGGTFCNVPVNPTAPPLDEDPIKQTYICLPSGEDLEKFKKFIAEAEKAGESLPTAKPKKDGTIVIDSIEFSHANDAKLDYLANGFLSDDVGRTAGFALNVNQSERGERNTDTSFKQETVGFGQRVKVGGQSRDPQGRIYLRFLNITTQEFEKSTQLNNKSEPVAVSGVQHFGFQTQTGVKSESTAMQVQDAWHRKVHKPSNGKPGLIYHYIDEPGLDREFMTAMAGLKLKAEKDIGSFHCMATGTALAGVDTEGRPVAEGRLEAQLSTGARYGRTVENPLVAITAWVKAQNRYGGPFNDDKREAGIRLASSVEVSPNVYAEVSVARAYYKSAADQAYSIGSKDGNDAQMIYAIRLIKRY